MRHDRFPQAAISSLRLALYGVACAASLAATGCSMEPESDDAVDGASEQGSAITEGATGVHALTPGTTWQWQLSGTIDTSVNAQMYDVDLFDSSTSLISKLHAAGRTVICYFSAGSFEKGRPDSSKFPAAAIGAKMDGWPENWIDTRNATVRSIMAARLDLAKSKGCDGVEPDNVDGYQNKPGFPLTAATQLNYNRFLAAEGHARGLSVGLKNDLDQVPDLVGNFDWALNEQCVQYNECGTLKPFIAAGKAVFNAEYGTASKLSKVCSVTKPLGFSSIVKNLDLTAFRLTCP